MAATRRRQIDLILERWEISDINKALPDKIRPSNVKDLAKNNAWLQSLEILSQPVDHGAAQERMRQVATDDILEITSLNAQVRDATAMPEPIEVAEPSAPSAERKRKRDTIQIDDQDEPEASGDGVDRKRKKATKPERNNSSDKTPFGGITVEDESNPQAREQALSSNYANTGAAADDSDASQSINENNARGTGASDEEPDERPEQEPEDNYEGNGEGSKGHPNEHGDEDHDLGRDDDDQADKEDDDEQQDEADEAQDNEGEEAEGDGAEEDGAEGEEDGAVVAKNTQSKTAASRRSSRKNAAKPSTAASGSKAESAAQNRQASKAKSTGTQKVQSKGKAPQDSAAGPSTAGGSTGKSAGKSTGSNVGQDAAAARKIYKVGVDMSCDYLGRTVEDKILDDKDNKDDKKLNQVKGLVNRGKKLVAPMRGKRYIYRLIGTEADLGDWNANEKGARPRAKHPRRDKDIAQLYRQIGQLLDMRKVIRSDLQWIEMVDKSEAAFIEALETAKKAYACEMDSWKFLPEDWQNSHKGDIVEED